MTPRSACRAGHVHGQLRPARLLELPERDFEDLVRKAESKEFFGACGQRSDRPAVLASRVYRPPLRGYGLRSPAEGLPELRRPATWQS